jgi:hypothetical protein
MAASCSSLLSLSNLNSWFVRRARPQIPEHCVGVGAVAAWRAAGRRVQRTYPGERAMRFYCKHPWRQPGRSTGRVALSESVSCVDLRGYAHACWHRAHYAQPLPYDIHPLRAMLQLDMWWGDGGCVD